MDTLNAIEHEFLSRTNLKFHPVIIKDQEEITKNILISDFITTIPHVMIPHKNTVDFLYKTLCRPGDHIFVRPDETSGTQIDRKKIVIATNAPFHSILPFFDFDSHPGGENRSSSRILEALNSLNLQSNMFSLTYINDHTFIVRYEGNPRNYRKVLTSLVMSVTPWTKKALHTSTFNSYLSNNEVIFGGYHPAEFE
jgi:hypothetical protein